jgi:hypothetical protein
MPAYGFPDFSTMALTRVFCVKMAGPTLASDLSCAVGTRPLKRPRPAIEIERLQAMFKPFFLGEVAFVSARVQP